MSTKSTQAERIAAEAAQPRADARRPRGDVIATAYRLQPDDLPEGLYTGKIHAITTQGVEALTPLAHLEGLAKPLALEAEDVTTLVRTSGSPFTSDWIGCKVDVRVVRIDDRRVVRLYAPGEPAPPVDRPARPKPRRRGLRSALGFVLILALALLAVYLVEQGPALWTLLQDMLSSIGR
ncbi:MAG: hypothetical protein M9936_20615 [Caldilinea sp.]|nr:hypothetical protein [Caldilinea sp.]MCB9113980.1 hypothetical protein [Caldilineaceae bacterium]MCB0050217.1 hypothetical protein [Caldilinea sp.]MCB9118531.1 hypothetical protein [Caldilineaceae bacterium]MCB9125140.1 hypothetical protein [Caldilineaceae bacterium]